MPEGYINPSPKVAGIWLEHIGNFLTNMDATVVADLQSDTCEFKDLQSDTKKLQHILY